MICTKCNGEGIIEDKIFNICDKCFGDKEIDWIENIVGKKLKSNEFKHIKNISERLLLLNLQRSVKEITEQYVFEPFNDITIESLKIQMTRMLNHYKNRKTIYNHQIIISPNQMDIKITTLPQIQAEYLKITVTLK